MTKKPVDSLALVFAGGVLGLSMGAFVSWHVENRNNAVDNNYQTQAYQQVLSNIMDKYVPNYPTEVDCKFYDDSLCSNSTLAQFKAEWTCSVKL